MEKLCIKECSDSEILDYLKENNVSKEVMDSVMEWCDGQRESYFQSGYDEGYGEGYEDGLDRSYEEEIENE